VVAFNLPKKFNCNTKLRSEELIMNKIWLYIGVIAGFIVLASIGFKVVESFSDDEVDPAVKQVEPVED